MAACGSSGETPNAVAAIEDVLSSIGDSCPECAPRLTKVGLNRWGSCASRPPHLRRVPIRVGVYRLWP
jgi:hypothetical protein